MGRELSLEIFREEVSAQGIPLLIYQSSLMNSAVTFSSFLNTGGIGDLIRGLLTQTIKSHIFKIAERSVFTKRSILDVSQGSTHVSVGDPIEKNLTVS